MPAYPYAVRLDFPTAFAAYLEVAPLWPARPEKPRAATIHVDGLIEVADQFDVAVLDGFGVLNVGDGPVPGMASVVEALQQAGKLVVVLTNGATRDSRFGPNRYRPLGYTFSPDHVISSRDALTRAIERETAGETWGLAATLDGDLDLLGVRHVLLGDEPAAYDAVDAMALLSSGMWTAARQDLLVASLERRPRPVLVGNPDMSAPFGAWHSAEPGYFALDLWRRTGIRPRFFGKPFDDVYDLVKARIAQHRGPTAPDRVLMVGDTPHTDILGGQRAGFRTALMTDHGFLRGQNVPDILDRAEIRPDITIGQAPVD